jgi:hypothetical protein
MAMMSSTQTGHQSRIQPPVSTSETCCRCGRTAATCTCCELICFERPNYHCGHLLTDADLSLQVRYVVEKNKLRNRTLTGHGIVCGLKLTCDPECWGHIRVHEGYAIDDCGNDIVVCETTRFDVLAALKAKSLIVHAREPEPCEPRRDERECRIKQCFYVTICYDEEACEYQTPFQSGCNSGPQDCVPTRTKERFRLEVTDKLPEQHSYLDRIDERLRHCFRLFCDSPVGRLIKQDLGSLKTIMSGKAEHPRRREGEHSHSRERDPHCELFRVLKAHFEQHLKQYPDELECGLAKKVARLCCPEERGEHYGPAMARAFAELFELMHHYQYDCVMADLVFGCPCPEKACCVVLGSVEIEDGCLIRVCNTHRRYVWSFANLIPILTEEALTAAFETVEGGEEGHRHERRHCCPEYGPFDPEAFLNEFTADECGRYFAASAPLRAIREVQDAFAKGFSFTDSRAISPMLFANNRFHDVPRLAEALGLQVTSILRDVELAALTPVQALLANELMHPRDRLRVYEGPERTVRHVLPDYLAEIGPERASNAFVDQYRAQIDTLHGQIAERDETIAALRRMHDDLNDRVTRLESGPSEPPSSGSPPSPPSPDPDTLSPSGQRRGRSGAE